MAERYDEQYRDRGHRDRGFFDRAGDEMRSWFGDDEAERRRRMDDRDWGREHHRGQEGHSGSQGYGAGDRSRPYGGTSFRRSGAGYGFYPGSPDFEEQVSRYEDRGRYGFPQSRGESGGYSGRGPRGYQRSDARINEDVCDCLCDAPDIDASDIEVKVAAGEVTLDGTVADREEKRRTEDLVERVSGVREVRNNLRVNRDRNAGAVSITGTTGSGAVSRGGSGGGGDVPHPGITGGGPSGATNISSAGGSGGAAGVPENPLGLRDTPDRDAASRQR
jgi:osmotically-inducible protein OsmY